VIVCVCFNVSDRRIRELTQQGASLAEVVAQTGAGTACGSCRLALARVHAGERVAAAPCARRAAERDAA
jgi:bacterioferritin-associated ferredoxin